MLQWGGTFGGAPGEFDFAQGLTVDDEDNVYVADSGNDRIQKFTAGGTFLQEWNGLAWCFDIDFGPDGNLYVAVTGANRVDVFSKDGTLVRTWGTTGNGPGEFESPRGVSLDDQGVVYVLDHGNERVQKFTTAGTYLTEWGGHGILPGQFSDPYGVVAAPGGVVLVIDTYNHRVQKFAYLAVGLPARSWARTKGQYGD